MNWIVRNATDLEMMMSSVERVEEYTNLETEFTEKGFNELGCLHHYKC